jgi:hypothetical protein
LLSAAIAASGDSESGLTSRVFGEVTRGVNDLSGDASFVVGKVFSRGVEGFEGGLVFLPGVRGVRGVPASNDARRGVEICSAHTSSLLYV